MLNLHSKLDSGCVGTLYRSLRNIYYPTVSEQNWRFGALSIQKRSRTSLALTILFYAVLGYSPVFSAVGLRKSKFGCRVSCNTI